MKRWCADCRRRSDVVDVSTEGHYAFGREVVYRVEWLACDHEWQGEERDAGPAPGAPEPLPRAWELGRQAVDPWLVDAG